MADRFPPRIAAQLASARPVGCRGVPVWIEDLDAMADRAETAEVTARELDGIVHDLMHITIGLSKTLELYAPATGLDLKADASSLFKRWAEVRSALATVQITGCDLAGQDADATAICFFEVTADGMKRINPKDVPRKAEETEDYD